jgi:hypothetical protein
MAIHGTEDRTGNTVEGLTGTEGPRGEQKAVKGTEGSTVDRGRRVDIGS